MKLRSVLAMGCAVLGLAGLGVGEAMAHPGHLIEAAGHDHWLAGAALAAAAALAALQALREKRAAKAEAEGEEVEPAEEEDIPEEVQEA